MENKGKLWSDKDLEIINEFYPKYGSEYCSNLLKRDKKAIVKKAGMLGIKFVGSKYKYSKENLESIIKKSKSIKNVLDNMGLRAAGGNYKVINDYIKKYNLNIEHFKIYEDERVKKFGESKKLNTITLDKILTHNSNYSRSNLKKRLYVEGLKKRECEMCGQNEFWKGKKMSLILDHINGVHNDNRIENLRIICPNCNATLDTHAGKNIHRRNQTNEIK